jgi:hypothetical protein
MLVEYAQDPKLRVDLPTVPTPLPDSLPAVPEDAVLDNFNNLLHLWM